jgi:hypothetical protein
MGALSVVVRDAFRQHRSKMLLVHNTKMDAEDAADGVDDDQRVGGVLSEGSVGRPSAAQ